MFTTKFLISFALYSFLQSFAETASGKSIVDGFKACKKSDPKLNECLLNMFKQVKPHLMQGDPELNLPPLDPVQIPRVSVQSTTKSLQVNGELSNLTAKGARTITIRTLKVDLKENTLDVAVIIPVVTFVTDFDLNVVLSVMFAPISRKGRCEGKISHSVVRIHANTEVKDGKQKLDDIKVNLHIGDLEVHMIKAQKPSSEHSNSQFFDNNKRMVLDLVTPIAEDVARQMLIRYSNRILSMVKVEDLLVD